MPGDNAEVSCELVHPMPIEEGFDLHSVRVERRSGRVLLPRSTRKHLDRCYYELRGHAFYIDMAVVRIPDEKTSKRCGPLARFS